MFFDLLKNILKRLPGLRQFTASAPLWPPSFKNRLSARILRAARAQVPQSAHVFTNLGIDSKLRWKVPGNCHEQYLYERPETFVGDRNCLSICRQLLPSIDHFVDVGCHLGLYPAYIRQLHPSCPISYFEPDPDLFSLIETNVSANRLPGIEGFCVALSDRTGETTFYKNLSDSQSGSLTPAFSEMHRTSEICVKVDTFSEWARRHDFKRALVKVDVENAEFAFAKGARAESSRISYLLMEVLGPACQGGFIRTMIRDWGWHAYYLNDWRLIHSPDGSFEYVHPHYNWLFCRLNPAELARQLSPPHLIIGH